MVHPFSLTRHLLKSCLRYTVNQKKEDTKYNRQYDPIFVFFFIFVFVFFKFFIIIIIYFIYLFLAVLGLCSCAWAFSSCGKWGLLFIAVHGLLIAVASLVAEHGL